MLSLPRLLPSLQASTSRLPVQAARFSTSSVAMKMKTHQGAAKRFKATAKGLFKRAQAGKAHLNTGYSAQTINKLSRTVYANKTQSKTIRELVPYA